MDTKEDPLEKLMSHLGEFGRYQCFQVFLNVLGAITSGMHMLALATTAGTPDHRCSVPWLEANSTLAWDAEELLLAIPREADGSLSSCLIYDRGTNASTACDSWVYNATYYSHNRVTQWDMVCDNRWMVAMSQSAYMFGVFVGAVACGALADKYGRKPIFCWSAFFQVFISIGIAFINNYPLFLFTQFFYGIAGSAGPYGTGFVLITEVVGASKRTICGMLFHCGFAVGIMLLPVWGSVIPHGMTMQLVIGAHSFLIFFHWWLLDESPRWLWGQGRISEAVNIVAKGVRFNKGPIFDKAEYISKGKSKAATEEPQSAGLLDLFKTPKLRAKTINIGFNWFANSIAYYGLSFSSNKMKGNPFMNLFIMALVEIPSYTLAIVLLDRVGRRSWTSILMLIGGGFCILTAILPQDMASTATAIAFLGKFCISGSFSVVSLYSAEIFPTVVRNTGIGFGASCARLAAMISPVVTLLDVIDKRLPVLTFAAVTLLSGFLTLFLPETTDQPMPETMEDGETFGAGDTAFVTGCLPRSKKKDYMPANPI